MSYTVESLANDTYERLRSSGADIPSSLIPRLATLVPSALRLLPIRVRERFGDTEAEIYRKNFTVTLTLTSGQGSLATHTALTSESMIPSEIVKVTHPDVISSTNAEGKLRRVGSSSALDLSRSQEYAYYAVENNTLFTMKGNDRTVLTGDATVRAAYPPLIGNVVFSHEPILLELMIDISQGMVTKAA
jgi:hypothetical protein